MSRHLAVDLGAESGRCVVATLANGKLEMEELCRFPTQGLVLQGSVRWNVYRFYEQILLGLKEFKKRYGDTLDSIGVDTWGCDYGLIDERGGLMELPFAYRDQRTQGTDKLLAPLREEIYKKSGVQFLIINTINQLVAAGKQENGTLFRATKLLFIADLLHYLLGAEPVNDYTVASISQLVDTQKCMWDDALFDKLNLPKEIQGRLVFPGELIGELSKELLHETGLKGPVKIVVPAAHDTASAILAAPAEEKNWGYISSGTWSLAGLETDRAINTEAAMDINASNSGGALDKNLLLKNVMGLWLIQQARKVFMMGGKEYTYDQIVKLAEAAPAFSAFIEPDDPGFFAPDNMVEAICAYLTRTGQVVPEKDDIGTLSRIIYESLSMKYRWVLENLCRVSGRKIDVLHIIGGGGKNDMLNRMTANALNIPVVVGPTEATAIGNALMQAYGCGELHSLAEIRTIVRNSVETRHFEPVDRAEWDRAYARFLQVSGL